MPNEYRPDAWVIVKITGRAAAANGPIYKVLGGWHGGYTQGDSWRLNSGITKIEPHREGWAIHGYSGSVYIVSTQNQRMTMVMGPIFSRIVEAAEADESHAEVVDISEVEL